MKELIEEYKTQFCEHCKREECNHGIVLINEEKVVDNEVQYVNVNTKMYNFSNLLMHKIVHF